MRSTTRRAIAVDSAGGLWVVDANESIRHYDAEGGYAASIGGRGEGPGEARAWATVAVGDGSILAVGFGATLHLFRPDGAVVLSRSVILDDGGDLRLVGRAGDRWAFLRNPPIAMEGGPSGGPPLVRVPFAVDRLGRLYDSDTLRYRIEAYDADGALRRVIERPVAPSPLPEDFASRVRDGVESVFVEGIPGVEPGGRGSERDRIERIAAGATPPVPPPYLPFIGRLLVAPDGGLWVERADRHPRPALRAVAHAFGYVRWAWHSDWAPPQVFDLFGPDGRYGGTVELPEEYAPMAIAGDRVHGVLYDELGVERVVVYEVVDGP